VRKVRKQVKKEVHAEKECKNKGKEGREENEKCSSFKSSDSATSLSITSTFSSQDAEPKIDRKS